MEINYTHILNKSFIEFMQMTIRRTYIVFPDDFVGGRIGMDFTLKIDIVSLFDVLRIQV